MLLTLVVWPRGLAGSATGRAATEMCVTGCPLASTTTPRIDRPRVTSQRSPLTGVASTVTDAYCSAGTKPPQRTDTS
jgi:hypothetical protein